MHRDIFYAILEHNNQKVRYVKFAYTFVLKLIKFISKTGVMVLNATFNDISAISKWQVLLVEETE